MYVSFIGISRGVGGGVVLEKIPSMGEVWIFSGITQYENRIGLRKQLHCMWSVEVGNITREFFFFSHRSLIRNNTQTAVCHCSLCVISYYKRSFKTREAAGEALK